MEKAVLAFTYHAQDLWEIPVVLTDRGNAVPCQCFLMPEAKKGFLLLFSQKQKRIYFQQAEQIFIPKFSSTWKPAS